MAAIRLPLSDITTFPLSPFTERKDSQVKLVITIMHCIENSISVKTNILSFFLPSKEIVEEGRMYCRQERESLNPVMYTCLHFSLSAHFDYYCDQNLIR